MDAKRIAPGKTKATVADFKKTAILSDREGPDQNGTDQEGSDTASKYDGYKGFLYIKCQHCGEIKSFCSKKIIKSYRCSECGTETPLKNLSHLWLNCECGRTSHYFTNMTEFAFDAVSSDNATIDTLMFSSVVFYPELLDGVIVATINAAEAASADTTGKK